jgi:hypothetical protein
MDDDARALVERLRERQKLKYVADCKCGHCQFVHIDDVYKAADAIERLAGNVAALVEALEQIAGYKPINNPSGMWTKTPADVARAALARHAGKEKT